MRYLASALGSDTTHSGISTFELSLDFASNPSANKGERANEVVRHIFAHADTDAGVIELLNYLYVENPYAQTSSTAFTTLSEKVLIPRGVALTGNGYRLSDGRDVDSIQRSSGRGPSLLTDQAQTDSDGTGPASAASFGMFSSAVPTTAPEPAASPRRDGKKIFVVHGRDMRPLAALSQYLQFLHLEVMPWSEAVNLADGTQPHTYDVVKAGMDAAAAVIVIFSPDDLARIKDDFSQPGDADRTPRGQARPNVLLEAGMAFALARERTIFLQSATTREISDIAGFNWVKLDGRWDSRNDLKERLNRAGANVRAGNFNLADELAGPFKVLAVG
jgi:predicted nucleotide-binding protein